MDNGTVDFQERSVIAVKDSLMKGRYTVLPLQIKKR